MYRVISRTPLSNGLKYGDVFTETTDINVAVLLARGRIAEVQSPPVSELYQLANIAPKLKEAGITTVKEFLDADPELLMQKLDYRSTKPIERYQNIAREALKAPVTSKRG